MLRLVPLALVLAVGAVATPVSAQQAAKVDASSPRDTVLARVATDSAVKDLERAVAAIAASVQQIVTETANNPEVRLAAVQVAGRAVTLAQQALSQNTSDIERLLAEASRMLERAERAQRARTTQPVTP